MGKKTKPMIVKNGFCIYVQTVCQGNIPIETDENDKIVVYDTELEAQLEIADTMLIRLEQFIKSKGEERDFDDAINTEEYVVPVTVYDDGKLTDEEGNVFDINKPPGH